MELFYVLAIVVAVATILVAVFVGKNGWIALITGSLIATLLITAKPAEAAEVNFSCYIDGVARCFPSEKDLLSITVDLVQHGEQSGEKYVINTDRKNRMVFIMFENTPSKLIADMAKQGITIDAKRALLEKQRK